jgi:GWxTD domain-containing protein
MSKKLSTILLGVLISCQAAFSAPRAYLMYASYNAIQKGPYLETYLLVMGNSVKFKQDEDLKFRGRVGVSVAFIRNGETVYQDQYTIISPEISDTLQKERPAFIDQQRIPLPNGDYQFELKISDINDPGSVFSAKQEVNINYPANETSISGIELLESFSKSTTESMISKSGYDLVPYVSNFYPKEMSTLRFYSEIYPLSPLLREGESYLIQYYIKNFSTKKILTEFNVFRKELASPVNVLLAEMDINSLPSGNYELMIDVKSKENQILSSQKLFFQRSNSTGTIAETDFRSVDVRNSFVSKIHNADSLREFIRSLRPKAIEYERNFIDFQLANADINVLQQFHYDFWLKRDRANPGRAWNAYNENVIIVQKKYGSLNHKGYDTDRGRVYLQYGAPNSITEGPYEPSAYPYEIWQFYTVGAQTNRRFVFYNPAIANNEYELIHSDVFGEVTDARWQMRILRRNNNTRNFDVNKVPDSFGGRSEDNYKAPR